MVELKKAYRTAALITHPDCGGNNEEFLNVDAGYDLLQTCASDYKQVNDSYWATYWESRLEELQANFALEWRKAYKVAKKQKTGLWYSTCISRFARAYMYPRKEWFFGVLFKKPTTRNTRQYRKFLLEIAPNQQFREQWALKYYRLEFGQDTPYVFYLPPPRESHIKALALI